jgi:hypothetical protein
LVDISDRPINNQLTSTSGLGIPASDNATRANNETPKTFILLQSTGCGVSIDFKMMVL